MMGADPATPWDDNSSADSAVLVADGQGAQGPVAQPYFLWIRLVPLGPSGAWLAARGTDGRCLGLSKFGGLTTRGRGIRPRGRITAVLSCGAG